MLDTNVPPADPVPAQATVNDPAMERLVMRKVTWRLIPFMFVLYIIAYLDRINVSFAGLQMNEELGFTKAIYGLGAGIFFIGYFLFEVPSNLIMERTGARIWIARIMVTWGLISAGMMFVKTPHQFYAMRFLLGVAEAGFFPGMILYLTYWYPRAARANAVAWFMTATAVSGVIGGPVSGALLKMHDVLGLSGWQWLFLIEGAPAVGVGVFVLYYLTDRPEQARWLQPEERAWLAARLQREHVEHSGHDQHSLFRALANGRVWLLSMLYFSQVIGFYGLQLWLPEIIKGFGLSDLEVGFATALPHFVSVIGMVLIGLSSDRCRERRWHVALSGMVGGLGLLASAYCRSLPLCLLMLSIACVGMRGTLGPFWALSTSFLGGTAAAGGIALINSIGNLGGFVGPTVIGWVTGESNDFTYGLLFLAVTFGFGSFLALCVQATPAAREYTKL